VDFKFSLVLCIPACRAPVLPTFLRCIVQANAGRRRAGRGWRPPGKIEFVFYITASTRIYAVIYLYVVVRALYVCDYVCMYVRIHVQPLGACLLMSCDSVLLPTVKCSYACEVRVPWVGMLCYVVSGNMFGILCGSVYIYIYISLPFQLRKGSERLLPCIQRSRTSASQRTSSQPRQVGPSSPPLRSEHTLTSLTLN